MAVVVPSATPISTRTAALILYWDYDTQWGGDRSRAGGGPKAWGHDEFVNTERLLELHAAFDIPACFAVVGAAALPGTRPYHDPAQIRALHAAGHEVASHSFQHEWLPGLGAAGLRETLLRSKEALEDCIGAPVESFVPPYNQPFDHAAGWSFSLSERRTAGADRIDVQRLCAALRECGYRTCRVSYRPMYQRAVEALARRRLDRPVEPELIEGVTCLRLNTPGGFAESAQSMMRRCVSSGGLGIVYGHPHSLRAGGEQDERHLVTLLEEIRRLRDADRLTVTLPRTLAQER